MIKGVNGYLRSVGMQPLASSRKPKKNKAKAGQDRDRLEQLERIRKAYNPVPLDQFDMMTAEAFIASSSGPRLERPNPPHPPKISRSARKEEKAKKQAARRKEYDDYINGPKWKAFRLAIIAERGKRCEECGTEQPPHHLHHKTYKRFMNELPEDVVLLCYSCHEKTHKRSLKGERTKPIQRRPIRRKRRKRR